MMFVPNVLSLFMFFGFAQVLGFNFNKLSWDGSFLRWREIELARKEHVELISLSIPIVFSHEQYNDVLIDRDGYICFGTLKKNHLLGDILHRTESGQIKSADNIGILTPFKIPWNETDEHSKTSYRLLSIEDPLLDCSDKELLENFAGIIKNVFHRNFTPKEVLLSSWINMTASDITQQNKTKISFEQSIITDGVETFQIINYLSGHEYLPIFPTYEPIAGIYSNINNQTIRVPVDVYQDTWNKLHIIQLDNLNHLNLSGVKYLEVNLNEVNPMKSKCVNHEISELLYNYNKTLLSSLETVNLNSLIQNDVGSLQGLCDSQVCSREAYCQMITFGKCCTCKKDWIGDGITCVYLPTMPEPAFKLNYEGNLTIENDDEILDTQSFRLIKVVNNRKESERIHVNVQFSKNLNFLLTSFAMPSLFLLPMWITATPYDGGRNLIQLTGGSIKNFVSVCNLGNLVTFHITGQANRLDQDLKGSWNFFVKGYGTQNVTTRVTDLEHDSHMYTIQFQSNDQVIIENTINIIFDSKNLALICRATIKLDRGCIQEPDVENKKMYLIIQRISLDAKPESGVFYVGKALVTMNPCIVSEVACTKPNTVCIYESIFSTHKCVCNAGYTMTKNKCEKVYSNFICNPPCHTNATCFESNKCICNKGYEGNGYICFNCNVCNKNAECFPQLRRCRCKDGFVGNGFECREEFSCGVTCHENASCVNGYCKCHENLTGDGINACFDCLKCHIEADCSPYDNRCFCRPGFTGDGFICQKSCGGQNCHKDASCENSKCVCRPGFEGDGIEFCFDCSKCHKYAYCNANERKCICRDPYVGDGILCQNYVPKGNCFPPCSKHAICTTENKCQCRLNYYGDPYAKCNLDCSKCHKDSDCDTKIGYCICRYGYFGDGFFCNKTCCTEKCHKNGQCVDGKCVCKSGFTGDGVKKCFNCFQCHPNATCVKDKNECICMPGYEGDGMNCLRQIVCRSKCHSEAICSGGKCICKRGLRGDGINYCFDCKQCDRNALCIAHLQKCQCNQEYQGNGLSCSLKPICRPSCHPQANCINGVCICINNLIGDGINSCFDCDKCSVNGRCDTNKQRCYCNPGFEGNGFQCVQKCYPSCHKLANCINGRCKCLKYLEGDGIQYCFNCSICDPNARCFADEGKCQCVEGFEGNGFQCYKKSICSQTCGENAICIDGICQCKPGLEGNPLQHCFDCRICHYPSFCDVPNKRCVCNTTDETKSKTTCSPKCGENALCINGRCQCQPGLQGNPFQHCFDCRKCSVAADCDVFNKRCICRDKFIGDGITCIPISDCSGKCHSMATCVEGSCKCSGNLVGDGINICFDCSTCDKNAICYPNRQECVCKPNYIKDKTKCTLIGSATLKCQSTCLKKAKCINGNCECDPGLIGDGVNFCFNCTKCDINSDCIPQIEKCECKSGFYEDGRRCLPISETCRPGCGENARCINGRCECLTGFQGNPLQHCFDCRICSQFADCDINNKRCICKSGYEGNGFSCNKIKECIPKCHSNAICINDKCRCLPEFIGDGVNFCFNCASCDPRATCYPEQQMCKCDSGYSGDGRKCSLIAPIKCTPECGENARCIQGKCECVPGFQGFPTLHCFNCQKCDKNAICDVLNKTCICKSGFEGNGEFCIKEPDCIKKCHVNAICKRQECSCLPGLLGDGINYCFNCSTCDRNSVCSPELQKCVCTPGYLGNGIKCSKIESYCMTPCHPKAFCIKDKCHCLPELIGDGIKSCFNCSTCDQNAICRPQNGICVCKKGFVGNGIKCSEIISTCQPKCHPDAVCYGSTCICQPGLEGDGNTSCFNCTKCDKNAKCFPNENKCICLPGFKGNGFSCFAAKLECQNCHTKGECINGICKCKSGFEGNGVDFCMDCSICDKNADCIQSLSKCECRQGFKGDGKSCVKIDECSPQCHANAICINSNCHCLPGFTGNGVSSCFNCSLCDSNAICKYDENRCICNRWFSGDGFTCIQSRSPDCNTICHKDAICFNNTCICKSGFSGDGKNYCFNCGLCDRNAICRPVEKRCICQPGFQGDGFTCASTMSSVCQSQCHPDAVRVNDCCRCRSGFFGDGFIFCFNCTRCSSNADCLPHMSKCQCREGYVGDGFTCLKKECQPQCPLDTSICINSQCFCRPGLIGDGQTCLDCRNCHDKASCNIKSMRCECLPGFTGNGMMCVAKNACSKSSECTNTNEICDIPFGSTMGQCVCDGKSIQDPISKMCISQMCQPPCHSQATCNQGKCECNQNYIGNGYQCKLQNSCTLDTDCLKPFEICRRDSFTSKKVCICQDGTERNNKGKCIKPDCNGGCHEKALCVIGGNKDTRCLCLPGFVGDGMKICVNCSKCDLNAFCTESKGCVCKPGFIGDGQQCIIMNECVDDSDCILLRGATSKCKTTINGVQKCTCAPGSTLINRKCEPLGCPYPCAKDAVCIMQKCECLPGLIGNGFVKCINCSECGKQAQCHEQRGCVCNSGYIGNGIQCRLADQCDTKADCNDINKECVKSPLDSVKRCICKATFVSSDSGCIPISCSSKCHKFANCDSGICKCVPGYIGDGISCRLPDECKSSADCKYANQECVAKLDSSLICTCKPGFQWYPGVVALMKKYKRYKRSLNPKAGCVPIDCTPKCHSTALCLSGTCLCPPSFKGNGYSGCFDCSKCHSDAYCDEFKGCTCKTGFQGSGCYCRPVDKCQLNSDCNDPLKLCTQASDMSRKCTCKPGTVQNNEQCLMIGCSPSCDPNAVCISNKCICKTGFTGDGLACRPSDQCSQNSECPMANSRCEMMKDYIRKCVCLPGFQDENGRCMPKECLPKCHMFAKCITQTCYCLPGYFGDGIKSCTSCSVCHKDAQCLPDRGCVCKSDFVGDGFNCRPLDECRINEDCRDPNKMCLLNPSVKNLQCTCKPHHIFVNNFCLPKECNPKCHKNARCESGTCQCSSGFVGDGFNCQPPFECGIDNPCKDKFSVCQLTPNAKSFVCICVYGFKMISTVCQPEACPVACHPLAQCKFGKCTCPSDHLGDGIRTCVKCSTCHSKAICSIDGCKCIQGYQGNGIICQLEDQCQYDSDCRDRNAVCLVGNEKFKKCICKPGFTFQNSLCTPIACNPNCHKNAKCQLGICVCKDGYSLSTDGSSCVPIDHCQSENDCSDSNHKCVYHALFQGKRCMCRKGFVPKSVFQCVEEGCPDKCHIFADCRSRVCQCRLGFQGDGVLNCHDCSVCHPNAICSPSLGCTCPGPNLIGDGKSCKPKDECRLDSDCRDSNAVCTMESGSLKCQCKLGYIRQYNNLCSPIPCLKPCQANEECVGGQCQCKSNFALNSNSTCIEQNECEVNTLNSCKNPLEICVKLPNSKSICTCRPGFMNKFGYCLPLNCYQPCHLNAYCKLGTCTCNPGYTGDGITSCRKLNECQKDSDCANAGSVCTKTDNVYSCKCPEGFINQDQSCIPKTCVPSCDQNAICILGTCICKIGYSGNGFICVPDNKCSLTDKCADPNSLCQKHFSMPFYDCLCKPGFIKTPYSPMCQPIVCNPKCHLKAECIMGSCICMKPLVGNGIDTCRSQNECTQTLPCSDPNAVCKQSMDNNFRCICKIGFKPENDKCVVQNECKINADCPINNVCVNSKCICPEQYVLSSDGKSCELPKIIIMPNKIDIPESKDAEILCFYENGIGNVNYLSWRKISPLMSMNFIRQLASAKLNIQKATVGDSGIYQCCVESKSNPLHCKYASINVFTKKCIECPPNQHCDPITNNCICDAGFQLDANGICQRRNCLYFPDICDNITMNCDRGNCVCKSALYMANKVCAPKDQCKTNKDCDPNAICKTDKRCHCGILFTGPGKICTPIKLGCEVTKDCDINGKCVQIGVSPNMLCQCNPGFVGDGKTCKPAGPMENLLISQGYYIWKLPSLNRKKRSTVESKFFNPILWKKLSPDDKISIIDSNCQTKSIYWILKNQLGIFHSSYSSPQSRKPVLLPNIWISGVAVDWISDNLFWTSETEKSLGVINIYRGFEKVIFSSLTSPSQITINPKDAEMFWICKNKNIIKIDFAYMDGSGYRPLITDFIVPPEALIYDIVTDKLCWLENNKITSLNVILCLHPVVKELILVHDEALEASSKTLDKVYEANMGTLYSLRLVASKVLWTAKNSKNYLYVYDSKTVTRYTDVKSLSMEYSSVTVLLDECEKVTNSCSNQNQYGNCRFICLPLKNQGRICECPQGMEGCNKYQ